MRDFPRIYVDNNLTLAAEIMLSKEQSHYLVNVMRRKNDDFIIVFDGINGEFLAKISEISKKSIKIKIIEQTRPQLILPNITLFFAPIKGNRNDNIIEKASELGIKNIIPIITERTIVRKPNIEKYRQISIEAIEQCEGLCLPEIHEATQLINAITNFNGDKILFADEAGGGQKLNMILSQNDKHIGILIGPEGGFSESEREKLLQMPKICPISLGPRILRADSAAISTMAIVQELWGDWKVS